MSESVELKTPWALVTGGAGWLGQGLLHSLAQGLADVEALRAPAANARIRALVLPAEEAFAKKSLPPGCEIIVGDTRDPSAAAALCQGAKDAILFHTAGVIHPRRVADFFSVNVEGTRNILAAAQNAGARRAVVVSSNSPCGCNPAPDHLFDEGAPFHPYMGYGRSKMAMELLVQKVQAEGNLQTVVIRPPWFYGPFQPPRQTLFFQMIRDGVAPVVGNGENRRSMAYIDNLCQGLIRAAASPRANGQTYWIADERPYTMNEIIGTIETVLERDFSIKCRGTRRRLPGVASEIALMVDASLQKLGLYHQKIHVLSEMNKTIACSIAKATRELDYRPTVALEEGMRRSIAWLLENGGKL